MKTFRQRGLRTVIAAVILAATSASAYAACTRYCGYICYNGTCYDLYCDSVTGNICNKQEQ